MTASSAPSPTAAGARRNPVRRVLALLALVLAIGSLAACMPVPSADAERARDLMNTFRYANAEWPLNTNPDAFLKAQGWAEQMAREGRLYHSNLTEGAPWGWRSVGENVGCGPDLPTIQRALEASPGHRANMVDPRWDYVGVGVARGKCGGYNGWYVTQYFVDFG